MKKPLGLEDRKSLVVPFESQGMERLICELWNTFVNDKPVSIHIIFLQKGLFHMVSTVPWELNDQSYYLF